MREEEVRWLSRNRRRVCGKRWQLCGSRRKLYGKRRFRAYTMKLD
jgi:hypothetical protein